MKPLKELTIAIKKGRRIYIDFGSGGYIDCVPLENSTLRVKIVEEKK